MECTMEKEKEGYVPLTHEELVQAVYELAQQLEYSEKKRLMDEILAKRKI